MNGVTRVYTALAGLTTLAFLCSVGGSFSSCSGSVD